MMLAAHINEIDNDNSAGIPEPDQPRNFPGRLHIRPKYGIFQIVSAGKFPGIHIDHRQSFRRVPNQIPASGQPHFALKILIQLLLDSVVIK